MDYESIVDVMIRRVTILAALIKAWTVAFQAQIRSSITPRWFYSTVHHFANHLDHWPTNHLDHGIQPNPRPNLALDLHHLSTIRAELTQLLQNTYPMLIIPPEPDLPAVRTRDGVKVVCPCARIGVGGVVGVGVGGGRGGMALSYADGEDFVRFGLCVEELR
jgi:hypothetical protein